MCVAGGEMKRVIREWGYLCMRLALFPEDQRQIGPSLYLLSPTTEAKDEDGTKYTTKTYASTTKKQKYIWLANRFG